MNNGFRLDETVYQCVNGVWFETVNLDGLYRTKKTDRAIVSIALSTTIDNKSNVQRIMRQYEGNNA